MLCWRACPKGRRERFCPHRDRPLLETRSCFVGQWAPRRWWPALQCRLCTENSGPRKSPARHGLSQLLTASWRTSLLGDSSWEEQGLGRIITEQDAWLWKLYHPWLWSCCGKWRASSSRKPQVSTAMGKVQQCEWPWQSKACASSLVRPGGIAGRSQVFLNTYHAPHWPHPRTGSADPQSQAILGSRTAHPQRPPSPHPTGKTADGKALSESWELSRVYVLGRRELRFQRWWEEKGEIHYPRCF